MTSERLFAFALDELVRAHRDSFAPLWTQESWAKLMIWLALNCGCSGDRAGLEAFAGALAPALSGHMRRLFFRREFADLGVQVLADPAESLALVLSDPGNDGPLTAERATAALVRAQLQPRLTQDQALWQLQPRMVAIPWAPCS
jgi:hypothetical protein